MIKNNRNSGEKGNDKNTSGMDLDELKKIKSEIKELRSEI